MLFPIVEIVYQATLDPTVDPGPSFSQTEEEDLLALPAWVVTSSCSHDLLNDIFPLDDLILKAMNGPKQHWEEMHH